MEDTVQARLSVANGIVGTGSDACSFEEKFDVVAGLLLSVTLSSLLHRVIGGGLRSLLCCSSERQKTRMKLKDVVVGLGETILPYES